MMKPVFVAAAIALVPVTAYAELPNGAVVTLEELKIREGGGGYSFPSDEFALREYLNMAHCRCSARANENPPRSPGDENGIQYLVKSTADTGTDKPVELWVGTQCDDDVLRENNCRPVGSIANIDNVLTSDTRIEITLHEVMTGKDPTAACDAIEGERQLWMLFDSTGGGTFDHEQGYSIGTTEAVTRIDTKAPNAPTDFVASSAEKAIRLEWTIDEATQTDVFAFQALCAKSDGSPAFESRRHAARYTRVVDLCGLADGDVESFSVAQTEVESSDETPSSIPPAMGALDDTFICGETTDKTATGMLIDGLDNDVPYSVILVTVDEYGNAVGSALNKTVTPRIAYDFWEDLHNRGSNVEGGFCLAGTQSPGGTAGPLALALGWLLVRRRRAFPSRALARCAPVAAVVVGTLVVFGGTHVASAQGTPYWEEQQEEDALYADQDLVKWHVGLRLGPYTPDIDRQFGMDPGPYAEMFGGYQVLPMLDIDRIVWTGFGQLGFGGSLGYMQKTANAWADPVPGEDRMRSSGDENTFRLWPIVATAVYRFTWLDDNHGIPVVPYVRGGLSYYIWWMRTNGKTSEACWDGTNTPDCDADKAVGATIGVQGSIGLAIRAERVDAAAASAMRQGGIMHAGFYAELQMAKVDGFGSEFKLSVGDTTWFAGVNFEF
ncbi:MAG: MXAN_2562 family outer membrane beta-barrel protein [Kofleriaceae bacterium]